MTISTTRITNVRSTAGTLLLAVALASAIGGLSAGPALGQDHGWRQERHDRDRYQRDQYRHDRRDHRGRRAYRPAYEAPVYAPPPIVYVPAPSTGIHLFFPLFR